jgi:hypothetical protein
MMNQEGIFKKVGQILNELQDQYDFLARNPGQLNDLELELFLANANFLSDHVQIVKKFNSNKPLKELPEHSEDQSEVTAVAEIEPVLLSEVFEDQKAPEQLEISKPEEEVKMVKEKTLEELEAEYAANELQSVNQEEETESTPEPLKFEFLLNDHIEDDKFEFEQQSVETIFDRPLSKEEEEIIAEKKRLREQTIEVQIPVQVFPVAEQVEEKEEEKVIDAPAVAAPVVPVFEKPVEKVEEKITVQAVESDVVQVRPTLNDLLASKSPVSNTLNEENNNKAKITDLKQAINLNEKLLYIKDLFNGYNLAYAEAIELINKMPDFKTADNFLRNNYAVKNNWADKQGTVDKFYDLLNQRFEAK